MDLLRKKNYSQYIERHSEMNWEYSYDSRGIFLHFKGKRGRIAGDE